MVENSEHNQGLTYKQRRKHKSEFKTREEYLNYELEIARYKRWGINLPFRDYRFEIEDWVPAIAATIGKIVMVAAMAGAFAAQFGLDAAFIAENVRYEMLIAGILFVIVFSGILNPRANLAGTHGPMIPLIPLVAVAGGHPLALGVLIGLFGLLLSVFKGGSKLVTLTGVGVRAGLLLFLGATGTIGQIALFNKWATNAHLPLVSVVVIFVTIALYAYLARVKLRWLAIPLCSLIAGLVAFAMGVPFEFVTEPGLPNMSPFYWWGETTGWKLGWPTFSEYIAVIPFAILAVAMWSPDFLGHRVFQELSYPKKAEHVLMDVDDTMTVVSFRQMVGSILGGANISSSWGTYMIPAAIAKRAIPAGAMLTGLLCVVCSILGFPMDLAMWEPVLRVALLVGVFLPLLEAGMQMVANEKDSQSAGICIFASALVNPVFGWSLAMLLDNLGFIGDKERAKQLSFADRLVIPSVMFVICGGALALVGQIPGIPSMF